MLYMSILANGVARESYTPVAVWHLNIKKAWLKKSVGNCGGQLLRRLKAMAVRIFIVTAASPDSNVR